MIDVMIVDDEQLALELAKNIIMKHKELNLIGTFISAYDCLKKAKNLKPQLVFLDIKMPGINGIEVAEKLLEINSNTYIVFLTAYDIFATEEFDALDYIIKPLNMNRLEKTMERYRRQARVIENKIDTNHSETLHLQIAEVLSIEVERGNFQPIKWRTAKAQELFTCLLQHTGEYVAKETLMKLSCGDNTLENSAILLYMNIYNIRKAIQQYEKHFLLKNSLDGYVLELCDVEIDLLE